MGSNHLRRLGESSLLCLLRDTSPVIALVTIHDIVHRLTSCIVLGNFRTLYWSCSLAVHYTMNSTTASARIRSISCFITSLSNSSSWRWVIHSAFGPYLAVNLINFIFMHADVLDVLPERINVSIGIKSCKVSCSFHCLFLRIISR